MLFVILNTQTENGEIKRADQREAVSRKNWSRNGRKATKTERKPTVFVILDCRSRQYIVGGSREYLKRLLAYAIMAVAKKEVVSKRYTKRKPQSVTSGAFFRLVVTVVSV